ncbi:MAG: hypothetical protein D6734_00075 [Candidatus Schekmanbacteria bacterium]|nr:MAG: hypothetical protein D6734_00075 [Candidatus Schekmanbacteria bacterium]
MCRKFDGKKSMDGENKRNMKKKNPDGEVFKKYWEIKLLWSKILFILFLISFLSLFLFYERKGALFVFLVHFAGISLLSAFGLFCRGIYEKSVEAATDFMY